MMRFLRVGLAVLAGGLVAFASPAPASAHAYLAVSAPADGAVLDRAPEMLVLSFTERVELSATRIDIVDGDGRHWAPTSVAVRVHDQARAADTGTEIPVDVVAALPTLPANIYHVSWQTLSSDDLHKTNGTLVIGVQREVTASGTPPGPGGPGIREAILRGTGLVGLCVLLGGAALALVHGAVTRRGADRSRPGAAHDQPGPGRRLLRFAAAGGAVALVIAPLQLLVQTSSGSGKLLVAQATSGRWLMREVGLAALLVAVLLAWRGIRHPALIGFGSVAAVLTAIGTAQGGHPMSSVPVTTLVGAVHVLAAGAWAGSVIAAALALLPVLRTEPDQVRQVLRAFALVAASCLALLMVTGLLMVGAQVASVDALLTTPYGVLLLGKVTAVAIAGLLGLRTYRKLRRRDATVPGRGLAAAIPGRGLAAEALVFGLVLALAGALAAAGPARGPRFPANLQVATEPQVTGQAADLVDTLQIRPNRPGRNVVTVSISDTRRPAPGPVTGVSVQLTGPDGTRRVHPVPRTADGWTLAVDDIRTPGEWRVSVTIMRQGLAPVTDGHPWVVAPASQSGAGVFVSAARLLPIVNWLAGLAAAGAVLAALMLAYRRRRSAAPPPVGLESTSTPPPGGADGSAALDDPAAQGELAPYGDAGQKLARTGSRPPG